MKNTQELSTLAQEDRFCQRAFSQRCSSSPQCHAFMRKVPTGASAVSCMRSMNCTKPSIVMDAGASRQTTSAANCTRRGSVAGASVTNGGMNTSTAGTRCAIGTSTITTAIRLGPYSSHPGGLTLSEPHRDGYCIHPLPRDVRGGIEQPLLISDPLRVIPSSKNISTPTLKRLASRTTAGRGCSALPSAKPKSFRRFP